MRNRLSGRAATRLLVAWLASAALAPAWSQSERDVRVAMKPGAAVVLDVVGCAKKISPLNAAVTASQGSQTFVIYKSTPDQREERSFTAEIGTKADAAGTGCEQSVNRQYTLSFDAVPEVSGKALQTSFVVLMAALVLALLLENAFALLFNWRAFNLLLVGRTVRSPIMFAAALVVVRQFDFDLMARLFDAYYAQSTQTSSSWGTSILTAMILAGGSVGVNNILTSLGFRSPLHGAPPKALDDSRAWIAVEIDRASGNDKVLVEATEVTYDGVSPVRTVVGVAGNPRPSWKSIFSGDKWRVPRSGGILVDTGKYYTITAQDTAVGGEKYDVTGKVLKAGDKATIFRFGPRAILDFRIQIP